MKCNSCPRRCNAERTEEGNIGGFCQMPLLPRLARAALHFWEEPCISGQNGSGTVFFSGCSLACIYCQNYEISHKNSGKTVSFERLSEIFRELEDMGAHNINLVNPTHYTYAIKRALDIYKPNIPIVYNSGGYDSVETLKSMQDYIDIYLMDYKYISSEKSKNYSFAEDYPFVAEKALNEVYRQKSECQFNDGIMQSGVIVRHLILPQSTNDAIKVFDYVKNNMPNAYFSLMAQYVPLAKALEDKIINRRITVREYDKVSDYIIENGFQNCFIQELESAQKEYIPQFDLTGI